MPVSHVAPDASRTMLLPSSPQSPTVAREAIRGFCAEATLTADITDTASLLTSELITNAYRYGSGAMMMAADVHGTQLRVSVTDSNDDLPVLSSRSDDDAPAERGRGLLLVATLATRWGTKIRATCGKAVWFELEPVR